MLLYRLLFASNKSIASSERTKIQPDEDDVIDIDYEDVD